MPTIMDRDFPNQRSHRILDYVEYIADNLGTSGGSSSGDGSYDLDGYVFATEEDINNLF